MVSAMRACAIHRAGEFSLTPPRQQPGDGASLVALAVSSGSNDEFDMACRQLQRRSAQVAKVGTELFARWILGAWAPRTRRLTNDMPLLVLAVSSFRPAASVQLKRDMELKEKSLDGWPVLRRWDVPWEWPTISLTMVACAVSFLLTGMVEQSILEQFGFKVGEATLDEKAEVLFLGQFSTTVVVLGAIFGITNTFRPFSDDIFRYKFEEPFKLQNGWLLWAGIGILVAIISIALAGAAMTFLNGETPQRETDSLVILLPLIGSSGISTACLLGITGVLAPILEETVFRGFLMMSLTKWFSTPYAVLITAAMFAFAHLTPGEFPQLFVLGVVLGFSYAQTRNLLTPITIHAIWNSGVILLLTFLQLQGYDIKELLQAS